MTVTFNILEVSKGIGAVLLIALLVILFWLIYVNFRRFAASRQYEVGDRSAMRRRWKEVESLLDAPGELSPKLAVIEADKLLDHALKSMAMPGTTLGERLKFASYKYPKIREVWWAHKVRNQLVHEATYRLDRGIARKAVRSFRKALQLIGAI
ncbi:MAG: hypothetical protein U9Q03_04945 [Patescibacteria group bacterium]|nr:hypothetical protein [Patescibacteria group bacterium]